MEFRKKLFPKNPLKNLKSHKSQNNPLKVKNKFTLITINQKPPLNCSKKVKNKQNNMENPQKIFLKIHKTSQKTCKNYKKSKRWNKLKSNEHQLQEILKAINQGSLLWDLTSKNKKFKKA